MSRSKLRTYRFSTFLIAGILLIYSSAESAEIKVDNSPLFDKPSGTKIGHIKNGSVRILKVRGDWIQIQFEAWIKQASSSANSGRSSQPSAPAQREARNLSSPSGEDDSSQKSPLMSSVGFPDIKGLNKAGGGFYYEQPLRDLMDSQYITVKIHNKSGLDLDNASFIVTTYSGATNITSTKLKAKDFHSGEVRALEFMDYHSGMDLDFKVHTLLEGQIISPDLEDENDTFDLSDIVGNSSSQDSDDSSIAESSEKKTDDGNNETSSEVDIKKAAEPTGVMKIPLDRP